MTLLDYIKTRSLRSQYITNYPLSINIELTTRCNSYCKMCPRDRVGPSDIDFDLFRKIVDDIPAFPKVMNICPVGLGEPLLYPKILEVLQYIKEKHPHTPIRLVTNGILLNLVSIPLASIFGKGDSILISLNTFDRESYEKLTGRDKYNDVVKNIITLADERKRAGTSFSIQVQLILTKDNEHLKGEFKRFWKQYLTLKDDIPLFERELENWGGKIDTSGITTKNLNGRYPCLALWTVAMIDVHGNVYPCCEALADRNGTLKLGNVKDAPLISFYNNHYKTLREIHLKGNWGTIEECKDCDFWSSSPNIWKREYKQ